MAFFIQWFLNQAASNQGEWKEFQWVVQKWKTFVGRREQEQGSYTRQKKAVWLWQGHLSLGDSKSLSDRQPH